MRLAFQQHSRLDGWVAGIAFLENMFLALRTLGPRCPTLILVVSDQMPEPDYRLLASQTDELLRVKLHVPTHNQLKIQSVGYHFTSLVRSRLTYWRPPPVRHPLTEVLPQQQVDGLFSAGATKFALTSVPTVIWIPDFQHRRLPDNFSIEDRTNRDLMYAAEARSANRLLVTSEEVRRDLEAFAPAQASKARVIPYVADVPADIYDQDPAAGLAALHLPEKFIYLPNQFWAHKNHRLVFEALGRLRARGVRPCIVSTGSPFEYRRPALFTELVQLLSRLDIRDQFIILGQVPRAYIFHLIRQSICVLSASKFEGLGLSVAEAKSVGKRLLVSDLSPLREQDAPGALYFDPNNLDDLTAKLEQVWTGTEAGPDRAMEAAARAALPGRQAAFGQALLQLFEEAQADFNSRPRTAQPA